MWGSDAHFKSNKQQKCLHWQQMLQPGGNGTPLQDSCVENPMDGGAWYSNFLMRPASSGGSRGTSGTPCRQNMGMDPPVGIRRGEGAHRKWCCELWCFPRHLHRIPRLSEAPWDTAPLPVSPFTPPDRDRRVHSHVLSARGSRRSPRKYRGTSGFPVSLTLNTFLILSPVWA